MSDDKSRSEQVREIWGAKTDESLADLIECAEHFRESLKRHPGETIHALLVTTLMERVTHVVYQAGVANGGVLSRS